MTSYFDRKSVPPHQAYAILCRIIIPKHGWKIIRFNSSIIYVHKWYFAAPQVGFNGFNAARRLRNPHTAKATKIPLSPASYLVEGPVNSRLRLTHFWEWETIGKP